MPNYYEILEIETTATIDQIKRAYRKLALKYHPDKHHSASEVEKAEMTERFKTISLAYAVLSDSKARSQYDAGLHNTSNQSTANTHFDPDAFAKYMAENVGPQFYNYFFNAEPSQTYPDVDNIDLRDIFGRVSEMAFDRMNVRLPKRTKNITINVEVTLNEMYDQVVKRIAVKRKRRCPTCRATGTCIVNTAPCVMCEGHGQCFNAAARDNKTGTIKCPNCWGSGLIKVEPYQDRCSYCTGKRYINERKVFHFCANSPNSQVVYEGESDELPEYTHAGDLVIKLIQQKHPVFERYHSPNSTLSNMYDLIVHKSISIYEACYGVAFTLEYLDGKSYNIQTHRLNWDSLHRLPKMGLTPPPGTSHHRGDLWIKYILEPPKLNETQRKVLKNMFPPMNRCKSENVEKGVKVTENKL